MPRVLGTQKSPKLFSGVQFPDGVPIRRKIMYEDEEEEDFVEFEPDWEDEDFVIEFELDERILH